MITRSIDLTTKYLPLVDEIFKQESKKDLITTDSFKFDGAHSVKVYKIGTARMNDYGRAAAASRYGTPETLSATTQNMTLTKDRSFTFVIDTLDQDETQQQLAGATALARQVREVVIPEIDTYVYGKMTTGAGTKADAAELTKDNIYTLMLEASNTLDDNEIPETERAYIVTPDTYKLMKLSDEIILNTNVSAEQRAKGIIAELDGASIIRVPAVRLANKFGFMLAHKSATVAPTKLESYVTHLNPPGYNGTLVEGRVVYDAFVLENKAKGIYYQATT